MRTALQKVGTSLIGCDLAELTRSQLIGAAVAADEGYLTPGKKPCVPGGFLGTYMAVTEYGVMAVHLLGRILAYKGNHSLLPAAHGGSRRHKLRHKLRSRHSSYMKLKDRIADDLPGWLVRQLIARGPTAGPMQAMLFDALKHLGLHKRGSIILKSVLRTSAGACLASQLRGRFLPSQLLCDCGQGLRHKSFDSNQLCPCVGHQPPPRASQQTLLPPAAKVADIIHSPRGAYVCALFG